jgi:twitching motility protein PilT
MTVEDIVRYAYDQSASDIFIQAKSHPAFRIGGHVYFGEDLPVLSPDDTEGLARSILTESQVQRLERDKEVDVGLEFAGITRVRVNAFWASGSIGMVMRLVPLKIHQIDDLGLPPKIKEYAEYGTGVVLVTGPTGSGKSTTLAAVIDLINSKRQVSIITIEDPIEFVHQNKLAVVIQREVGIDTQSFMNGLKYSLRQNPDVILIGEMRDTETIGVALSAAETGHLVFSTLHTTSAAETLERIVGTFPAEEQPLICERLSFSLKSICAQKLIPTVDGGRVAAIELMVTNAYISKLIRDNRPGDIYERIQDGLNDGMQTMEQSLLWLYAAGWITEEEARRNAGNALVLRSMLRDFDRQKQMEQQAGQEAGQ